LEHDLEHHYVLDGPTPDYRPDPGKSLASMARARGVSVAEAYLDLAVASNGRTFLNYPFLNPDFGAVEEMLADPLVVLGLADSGAHVGQIIDAGQPTWFLTHWVRDTGTFGIEDAIRGLTSDTADLFGIEGRLQPGAFAEVNVIDLDGLHLEMPSYVHDFPCDAGRLVQGAQGYDFTIVNGDVFMDHGQHTGALEGRLLRSGADRLDRERTELVERRCGPGRVPDTIRSAPTSAP